MSKLIFTAEMFVYEINLVPQLSSDGKKYAAQIAQAIHDKYMASGTVVYDNDFKAGWVDFEGKSSTHQAILHDIKEIEKAKFKCAHGEIYKDGSALIYRCGFCGKNVVPKGGWQLAEGDGE